MFTYNEKDAFRKIETVTNKLGLKLFAKVRLFDLVEPRKGTAKYKTLLYKIQAKHVDFVICDQKLVARIIIELDDSSHDNESRRERDNFVDHVLKNTGYTVLRYRAIDTARLERDIITSVA
jgi:very-short-patch-repair endonuclease